MSLVPLAPFLDFARNDKEAHRFDEFTADEVFNLRGFGLHCCGIVSALRDSLNED
jgi:hypothetical protein